MRILCRWINQVDVEVDGRLGYPEPRNTGLLGGLSQGYAGKVTVAVSVATRLEPAPQFGVKHEQNSSTCWVHHQCRSGEVSGATSAVQGISMAVEQVEYSVADQSGWPRPHYVDRPDSSSPNQLANIEKFTHPTWHPVGNPEPVTEPGVPAGQSVGRRIVAAG